MDSTSLLNQIEQAQAQKEVTANENFAAASPAMLFARDAVTSNALTWGYTGGRYKSTLIDNDTVSLTANSTNYIVAAASNGAVSVSTSTTNWNNVSSYIRLYKVTTGAETVTAWEDHRQSIVASSAQVVAIPIACSDETTPITTGTSKITFRMPYAMTLTAVRASLGTPQSSGSVVTIDINENGSTILSTKLTIDNSEKTSTTAATPPVISDTALADDAEITVDIDQVGDGTAAGLKIYLIGTL